jgi:tetrahydromethanopterin S-methyltransferase subunit G
MHFTLTAAAIGAMIATLLMTHQSLSRLETRLDELEEKIEGCQWR